MTIEKVNKNIWIPSLVVEELRPLVPAEYKDISDEKLLAIAGFFQKIWYIIIDEEFTSKWL